MRRPQVGLEDGPVPPPAGAVAAAPPAMRILRVLAGALLILGGAALRAAPSPVVDLRAAALLMSGQDGGELRPDLALDLSGGEGRVVVSIRLPGELSDPGSVELLGEEADAPPVEVFVYSLGPGDEVVDRAGWSLGPGERTRLLAVRLEARPGGEIRVLARAGERLGLVRRTVPAGDAPAFWWVPGEEVEVLWAPGREPSGPPPAVAEPRPLLVPASVRPARLRRPAKEAPLPVLELVSAAGESVRLDVRSDDPAAGDGPVERIEVAIPVGVSGASELVLRWNGGDAVASRVRWAETATGGSPSADPPAAPTEPEIDRDAVRARWGELLHDALSGAGGLEEVVRLEQRVLEVLGPEAVRDLPDPWLADLPSDALIGLALLRLDVARLHGARRGGYAGAVQSFESAERIGEELADRSESTSAAELDTLVALEWLERGSRRQVRDLLEKAVAREDSAGRRLALGVLAEKTGRREEAVEQFERALELDPGSHEARLRLAVQLDRDGDPKRSEAILRELRSASSNAPGWISILALEEWARGRAEEDPEAVVTWLRSAVEARPEHPTLRLQLAWMLDRTGRRDQATAELERVAGLRPADRTAGERALYNRWPTAILEGTLEGLRRTRPERLASLRAALEARR